MAAHGWSADEDDLSAEPNNGSVQGWLSEEEADDDDPEAADLEAGSQTYAWADALDLSEAEFTSQLPSHAPDDQQPINAPALLTLVCVAG